MVKCLRILYLCVERCKWVQVSFILRRVSAHRFSIINRLTLRMRERGREREREREREKERERERERIKRERACRDRGK